MNRELYVIVTTESLNWQLAGFIPYAASETSRHQNAWAHLRFGGAVSQAIHKESLSYCISLSHSSQCNTAGTSEIVMKYVDGYRD